MTDPTHGLRPSSDPSRRPAAASRLVRALYTHNPFYVISADLMFIGLRMSFDPGAKAFDTWALISSLAGYTLLLAVTACLLVRYGKVWDDMRSVLLLVVMMFLAISATIDDVLVLRPNVGLALALGGLAFSVAVSEGLLCGMRLWLPSLYRGPYYLILTLFFVYPISLRQLLARPDSPTTHWALFGFSTAAGLAFLTLLPAIRRGASYVKGNGSPWRWPYYPWSLFFFLGLGVCGRAYYLCISLHNVEGFRSIFGLYFLVPFGFAVAMLILEQGLVSGRKGFIRFALAMPVGLLALAMVGHRSDAVYEHFLTIFQSGLGVAPPAATLWLATAFYGYAAWRSAPLATGLALGSLLALSVVGPSTLGPESLRVPNGWPLLPVALGLVGLAFRHREPVLGVFAAICLVGSMTSLSADYWAGAPVLSIGVHLAIVALLVLGGIFRDEMGEFLRNWGAFVLSGAVVAVVSGEPHLCAGLSPWWCQAYPFIVAMVAVAYAWAGRRLAVLRGLRFDPRAARGNHWRSRLPRPSPAGCRARPDRRGSGFVFRRGDHQPLESGAPSPLDRQRLTCGTRRASLERPAWSLSERPTHSPWPLPTRFEADMMTFPADDGSGRSPRRTGGDAGPRWIMPSEEGRNRWMTNC